MPYGMALDQDFVFDSIVHAALFHFDLMTLLILVHAAIIREVKKA